MSVSREKLNNSSRITTVEAITQAVTATTVEVTMAVQQPVQVSSYGLYQGLSQTTSDLRESPTAGASSNHMGIDIGCSYGVPIAAADAGVVTVAEWGESGGNYVMIDHGNGFVTMYLHNSSLAVSVGDVVSQGQTIAYAGSTGYSTGTHCHFSVFLNGSYVNPLDYL